MNQEIEQRNALLGLLGAVYGETKKLDQNLVGISTNLQPTSNHVKNLFERELRGPQLPPHQPHPDNAANLPYVIPPPSPMPPPSSPQQQSGQVNLVDSNELVATLKGIESNLSKLVEIFTAYDIKVQKKSNRKISKLNLEDKRSVHHEGGEGPVVNNSNIDGQHPDPILYTKPFE
jgi:hypothetical protein